MHPYQKSSTTPPTYLRAPEVAQMLNIGLSTWWGWCQAKKAPAGLKFEGCRRWDADEIRAFAEGRV